jgi:hypothetical protein
VEGDALHTIRMPRAESSQGELVTVFDASYEDGVRKPVVDERPFRAQVPDDLTVSARRWLHGAPPTLVPVRLSPDVVLPALRGSYGREYHYAVEAPTTQRMLPPAAAHGAVALAEHQTEGRGRLGRTWIDEPATGLLFSVALLPPPPVARWPELTLVAARAVAAAIGPAATIKHPNDVLVEGQKVAGILAEAQERVVLGIGINVGRTAWPGAGAVDAERLALLVDVLERLERGYDAWLARVSRSPQG